MAFSYGFFNSKELDRTYTAENFCDYLGSLICNGIQDNFGDCFSLSASDGLSVTIGTGKAWINGHYFISDTLYTVDLSGYQDESLPRFVAVTIVCDTSEDVRDVHFEITPGTPAPEPNTVDFADIPQKTRLRLYNVRLNPGATSLSEVDWLDHREDENICGYVKCILGKCRINDVINEFQTATTEIQGLRQQVTELAEVKTEMQEYIAKTGELQEKVDKLTAILKFVSGDDITDAGQIGDNAYYAIYTDGRLKITGNGETYSYFDSNGLGENPSPFRLNENITSVEISEKITSLGDEIFFGTGLTEVQIPSTVLSVEDFAFCGCLKLETVHISSGNIGNFAFSQCSSLKNVTISTNIHSIGSEVFGECVMLKSITYEGTVNEWKGISKSADWSHGLAHENLIEEIRCTDGSLIWDSQQKEWKSAT